MANSTNSKNASDVFDLDRFVQAQESDHDRALHEIQCGRKTSHWMWYIFPQFDGLGFSHFSKKYSIKKIAEAKAYLAHPVLGPRLNVCAEAVLCQIDKGLTPHEIFGSPDDMKLRSCATLFASVSGPDSIFHRLIVKCFRNEADQKTLELLGRASERI
ncbi:MAG: DUF1810 domain-containing protein [Candidatus Riflebacteria bacterium]|nr:DUF1810 domain-containing protein [Candidatus Riflebacteria bacterium]